MQFRSKKDGTHYPVESSSGVSMDTFLKLSSQDWNRTRHDQKAFSQNKADYIPRLSPAVGMEIEKRYGTKMKSLIEKTKATGREYGFYIYEDGSSGEITEGTGKRVKFNPHGRAIGMFHTHPYNHQRSGYFSVQDFKAMRQNALSFMCLGFYDSSTDQYVVKCASEPRGETFDKFKAFDETLHNPKIMKHKDYDAIIEKGTPMLLDLASEVTDHYVFNA